MLCESESLNQLSGENATVDFFLQMFHLPKRHLRLYYVLTLIPKVSTAHQQKNTAYCQLYCMHHLHFCSMGTCRLE